MEKKSLSQQTAERLYTMIAVERRLAPGEKLPGEVELAKELGVSRTTLREAIHVLVSQNLLEPAGARGPSSPPPPPRSTTTAFPTWTRSRGAAGPLRAPGDL